MEMRIVRWVIAGLIFSGFVFVLFGCVGGVLHRTEIRNLPDELEIKLSIGDTRQEVRYTLGDPLLDARSLGVEVYRKAGRDIDYVFLTPVPGDKVIGYVLVVYDADDVVTEFTADYWVKRDRGQHRNFWITAGGYHFLNVWGGEPVTLLGPAEPWEKLVETT